MSKVTEMVEDEATKAEAEPDEDGDAEAAEGDEVEGVPVDAPAAEPKGDPTEADLKALNREYTRHEGALRKVMGADFDLLAACDVCGGMGYAPPVEVRTNSKYIACETCNGFGQVLTGSRAPGNETQPCPLCAGRGFLEKLPPAPAGQPQGNGESAASEYGTPAWMGNPDLSAAPGYVAPV